MSSKEDPDYEPTKFRRKELSSRNSKLSYIIFFSILAVAIGIANVVLFNFQIPAAKRELSNCTIGSTFQIESQYLSVWASAGIFAVFSFIVAPIAKSTTNAWSPQTTAFFYMAPFVALLSIGIAVAAGFLGYCAGYLEGSQITASTIQTHLKVFYALLDLLLVISEIAVFFLLLSTWLQIRSKRNRSKETKEKEKEEKLKKRTNKEATDQTKTSSETPTQTEATSTSVSPPTAPLKNTSEESSATKTTPNVYFIQAPATPAANPLPSPPQQNVMNPYSAYGYSPGYNPGYFDPYDAPYYPMPPPPLPPPPPPPPQPPRRPRPRRPGFRPFRKGYGVRINRGYSVFPY